MKKFLEIEIYEVVVVILVEPTKTEFEMFYHDNVTRITDEEYREMYKDAFNNDECGGFSMALECGDYVLCVKSAIRQDWAAHEIFHTANRIACKRGFSHDEHDEPLAYLIQLITRYYYRGIKEMLGLSLKKDIKKQV